MAIRGWSAFLLVAGRFDYRGLPYAGEDGVLIEMLHGPKYSILPEVRRGFSVKGLESGV